MTASSSSCWGTPPWASPSEQQLGQTCSQGRRGCTRSPKYKPSKYAWTSLRAAIAQAYVSAATHAPSRIRNGRQHPSTARSTHYGRCAAGWWSVSCSTTTSPTSCPHTPSRCTSTPTTYQTADRSQWVSGRACATGAMYATVCTTAAGVLRLPGLPAQQ
jgi:hypothetical protein